MSPNFQREEKIFYEAVQLTDVVQRQCFLDKACLGNSQMRANVEKLLVAHNMAADFFEEGGVSISNSLLEAGIKPAISENVSINHPVEEKPGTRIGHYYLLEKIGEGGCGLVYLAEQLEPVRRKVALKIIKLGMDTKNVIARFEQERQALALMSHPHIARVFDAGVAETGRSYFVMELVSGVKITDYCDRHKLDTQQRLGLFIQVCHAIQHAHQKGIIHRDIKPSNILVVPHEDLPIPKVIDFGIAKAIENKLTEQTLFTPHQQLVGTPAYMSPEQAGMNSIDVDTRSDVYSLGVLLYELLTSKTPFDANELAESGLDEMRRTLREKEPYRPSAKLNTLHGTELTQTANRRDIEPPKLKSLLRGDLDWIVMMALEKDRRRRYQTANALAMDVQRFLKNEPILARPPSRLYRFQKLIRRNRIVFASGLVVTLALIVALGTVTWAFLKEKQARQRAETTEKITQAAFAISQGWPAKADSIVLLISNAPPSLESSLAYRSLGEWHALNERWPQASERYARLLQVNHFEDQDTASLDLLSYGTVLAELSDQKGYEGFREVALTRFPVMSNSTVADRILKATLLLPSTHAFCQKLEPFAEAAALKSLAPDSTGIVETSPNQQRANFILISACSFDGSCVGLYFNQTLDRLSATNSSNYQVPGTSVTNVTLAQDRKSAVLQLSQKLKGNFKVIVSNVKDSSQNIIPTESTAKCMVENLRFLALGDASGAANSVTYRGNVAIINSGGSDIWYEGDNFEYQYIKVTNDFDYCLRVQDVTDTDGTGFARAGLMARDSLQDITGHMVTVERNAQTYANNNQGTFQVTFRTSAGHPKLTESQPGDTLPLAGGPNSWVRLQRNGTKFICYISTNVTDWIPICDFDGASAGDRAFTNSVLYLGIATSAHDRTNDTTALVSDFGPAPHQPVAILAQPLSSVEWRSGGLANLRVVASGVPVFFQWRKDGVDIPSATNNTYSLPDVKLSDAGIYSLLVYNDKSSQVTSDIDATVRPDTDPPVLNEVISYDGKSIGVIYNKQIDPVTGTNILNYQVDGSIVTNATLMADGASVLLGIKDRVTGKFSVAVKNVRDLSSNTIGTESKADGAVLGLRLSSVGDASNRPFSSTYSSGKIQIDAGGSDIAGASDNFVYQYLMATNDFDFRLRVESVKGGGGSFARAGLMARDSLENSSSHQVMVAVNAGNTYQVIMRTKSGSMQTQSQPPNPLPAAFGPNSWVRLQRSGTTFYAYYSDDGLTWIRLYQFDSVADEDGPFANPICVGIATSAWSNRENAEAVVSNFGATQTMPADTMLSLALLEYRKGDYYTATDLCRRCITYPDYQAARVATAHIILALCCQYLHRFGDARSEFDKAQEMIDAQMTSVLSAGNSTQGFWFDWVAARVLLQEASANFAKSPPSLTSNSP